MVADVLVAKRQGADALGEELLDRVLDPGWVAVVTEAAGEAGQDLAALFDQAEQQPASVRPDVPAVEAGVEDASAWGPGGQGLWSTLRA